MSKKEELILLIETYEAFAARHDATADELVATANRQGWHDDLTQLTMSRFVGPTVTEISGPTW